MNIMKIYHKRRAVSPVLAAILLIGLAVAAAAVLFAVVLPMIGGTTKVGFVSAVAADRNNDGMLDQITVKVSNSGAAEDEFSDGTITFTGWSATGNVEIGLADPVNLVFKTTNPDSQVAETASVSITLSFDSTSDITITEADIDMDHAAALTDSDMLIDFTDSYGIVRSNTTELDGESNSLAAETHSGKAGFRVNMTNANFGVADAYRHKTNADNTDRPSTGPDYVLADSPETITYASTPILSFWAKKSDAGVFTGDSISIGFALFDGTTQADNWVYNQFDTDAFGTGYVANTWVRVFISLPDVSVSGITNLSSYPSGVFAGMSIRVNNLADSGDVNLYFDDFSVHSFLS